MLMNPVRIFAKDRNRSPFPVTVGYDPRAFASFPVRKRAQDSVTADQVK
jgi:hypothetical protein